MKYVDAFPKQGKRFEKDFAKTFVEDIVDTTQSWGVRLSETELTSLFFLCIDDVNICINQTCIRNKKSELHCVRVEMEIVEGDAIKFTFKPINKAGVPIFGKKPLAVKWLFSNEDVAKKIRQTPGFTDLQQTFLLKKRPSQN